jgi:hypothetical protein
MGNLDASGMGSVGEERCALRYQNMPRGDRVVSLLAVGMLLE